MAKRKLKKAQRTRLSTKAVVESIAIPAKGYTVVYDEVERALGIRVHAGGRRTWFGLFKVKGKTERPTFGAFPDITYDLARKALKRVRGHVIINDSTPREAMLAERAEPTLHDAFKLYRKNKFLAHGRKVGNINSMFDLYLAPWADWGLSKITRGHCEHLLADIPTRKRRRWRVEERPDGEKVRVLVETDEKVSSSMADHVIRFLRSVYNFARGHYPDDSRLPFYAGANPTEGIERHDDEPLQRRLRQDEVKRFFAELICEPNRDFRDWTLVSLWTGARSRNTRAMRWADIDLEAGEWTFTVHKGRPRKSGELRQRRVTVALASAVIELLRARQGISDEFVFPAKTKTGYMEIPAKAWARLLKRAKVSRLRIHDLRHSTASRAADAGASGPMLQAMLGHADARTSARYIHIDSEAARKQADLTTTLMLEKAGVTAEQVTGTRH
jgi:integrase